MARCQRVGQVWNVLSSKVYPRSSPSRRLDLIHKYIVCIMFAFKCFVLAACVQPFSDASEDLPRSPFVNVRFALSLTVVQVLAD
jgi:hypothetical protein